MPVPVERSDGDWAMNDGLQGAGTTAGRTVLLLAIFAIAACGLVFELLGGTVASYLAGNYVTQFSLVVGLFLTAMGVGSYLSRFIRSRLLEAFILAELALGVWGGLSALMLFWGYAILPAFTAVLVAVVAVCGTLVGLELPLLIRVLKEESPLRAALSDALAFDYLGALAASLIFPLVLLPTLGLARAGIATGLINVAVAGLVIWRPPVPLANTRRLKLLAWLAAAVLAAGFAGAGTLTRSAEDLLYQDEIILAQTTPYQRIIVTRWREDIRLYLDGNIQFSSLDEARYHEALTHPALSAAVHPATVLILGGGDGLAVREALKYPSVQRVDLVDIDPEILRLFRKVPLLSALNGDVLTDPRVTLHPLDAMEFLEQQHGVWDVIIADLPDPNHESLAKLYSRGFYLLVQRRLAPRGLFVTQATSPFYAPAAFSCIVRTVESVFANSEVSTRAIWPYHCNVPSFGEWGFVLAAPADVQPGSGRLPEPLRFLTPPVLRGMFDFPRDTAPGAAPVNSLDDPVLVRLYERGFRTYH